MNVKHKHSQSFLVGASWLALSTILLKIIGLIYKIPLSYMLGDEGMGYFNSAYTIYIFFYVVGTGGIPKAISIIVTKREAECVGEGYAVFKIAFKFFLASGTVLLALFTVLADFFAGVIGNEKALLAMYSIAPSILLVCASGVIRGYLSGIMRFSEIAISELISGILKLVLGLVFAHIGILLGKNLPTIAAYAIFGITVGSLAALLYLALTVKSKAPIQSEISSSGSIAAILKIALPITLASAVGSVLNILDLSIIMRGLELNGFNPVISNILYGNYSTLAVPMASLVSTLISPITTAMLPVFASALIQCNTRDYRRHLHTALTLTSLISVPSAVAFFFFPTELLSIIFERSGAVLAAPFLLALAPGVIILGPLTVLNTGIEAAEKPAVVLASLTLGSVVKLFVGIFLVKYTDLGVLAAPLGTSASYLASYLITRAYSIKLGRERSLVLKTAVRPLTASLIAVCISRAMTKLPVFGESVRLASLFSIAVFAVSYLTFLLLIYPKARNTVFKCVKLNKKATKHL